MYWNQLAGAALAAALAWPGIASALVVEIQGVYLQPATAGASCVEIAGVYPGVSIEPDRPGQTPRICHNAGRIDSIGIADATLVATSPSKKPIVIRFEHGFPPGVNGKVVARVKLQGFFATENGLGVPTGDTLHLKAFFVQGRSQDPIAEPFEFNVGDPLESALFEYSAKKTYLAAGPRTLKGVLKVGFGKRGHKLTFPDRCLISLDSGSTLEDKLETIDVAGQEELSAGGEGGAPPDEGAGLAPGAGTPGAEAIPKSKPEVPDPAPPPLTNLPPLAPLPPTSP